MNQNLMFFYKFMLWGGKIISHQTKGRVYTFTIETDDVVFYNIRHFISPDYLTGRILFTFSPGKVKAQNV